MKKLFSLCLICLLAVSAMAQDQNVNVVVIGGGSSSSSGDYVDLGLPSGTLWKRQNESGLYTYEQAINRFGSKLPERHHYVELKNECTWIWIDDYGYKVVGPNGNSITLPAAGYRVQWRCGRRRYVRRLLVVHSLRFRQRVVPLLRFE